MGNSVQPVGLKLDRVHGDKCVGGNDVDGSSGLEGGRADLREDRRINARMVSLKAFKRDVLEAAAYAAVASDLVGFRLEFEVIGGAPLGWTLPSVTLVKVRQIFANDEAPPRVTSVRGFYAIYFLLKDLWECDDFSRKVAEAEAATRSKALGEESARSEVGDLGEEGEDHAPAGADECVESKHDLSDCPKDPPERECPICMDRQVDVVPPCGHGLCKACFCDWRAKSSSCPTCRVEGMADDAWALTAVEDISSPVDHADQLVHALHTFIQMLPRLETRWERRQSMMRRQALKLQARQDSDARRARQASSARRWLGVTFSESSYDDDDEEEEEDDDDDDDDDDDEDGDDRDGATSDFLVSSPDPSRLVFGNPDLLRAVPIDSLDERAQVQLAMALSLQQAR